MQLAAAAKVGIKHSLLVVSEDEEGKVIGLDELVRTYLERLTSNVQQLIKVRRVSQSDMAKKVNMSQPYFSQLIKMYDRPGRGITVPGLEFIVLVAKELGVKPEELLQSAQERNLANRTIVLPDNLTESEVAMIESFARFLSTEKSEKEEANKLPPTLSKENQSILTKRDEGALEEVKEKKNEVIKSGDK